MARWGNSFSHFVACGTAGSFGVRARCERLRARAVGRLPPSDGKRGVRQGGRGAATARRQWASWRIVGVHRPELQLRRGVRRLGASGPTRVRAAHTCWSGAARGPRSGGDGGSTAGEEGGRPGRARVCEGWVGENGFGFPHSSRELAFWSGAAARGRPWAARGRCGERRRRIWAAAPRLGRGAGRWPFWLLQFASSVKTGDYQVLNLWEPETYVGPRVRPSHVCWSGRAR